MRKSEQMTRAVRAGEWEPEGKRGRGEGDDEDQEEGHCHGGLYI